MTQNETKYDYNQLVQDLFKEATQCLENKCHFAAIAMTWAAVDHAVDFELRGGAIINPKTGKHRKGRSFQPSDIDGKLKEFYSLYPEMKQCEGDILLLYKGLRNPFLHVRVRDVRFQQTNIKSRPVELFHDGKKTGELPSQPVQEVFIQVKDGPKLILGSVAHHDLTGKKREPDEGLKEGLLILAASQMAREAVRIARAILDQLAGAVEKYSSNLNAEISDCLRTKSS